MEFFGFCFCNREKEHKVEWVGRRGGVEKGDKHDQNTFFKKNLILKKVRI